MAAGSTAALGSFLPETTAPATPQPGALGAAAALSAGGEGVPVGCSPSPAFPCLAKLAATVLTGILGDMPLGLA